MPPYCSGTFIPSAPMAFSPSTPGRGRRGPPEAPVLPRPLPPERARGLPPVHDVIGKPRLALDLQGIDGGLEELAQLREKPLALLHRDGIELGLRVDQVQPQVAQEELLAEAGQLPVLFARGFRDL